MTFLHAFGEYIIVLFPYLAPVGVFIHSKFTLGYVKSHVHYMEEGQSMTETPNGAVLMGVQTPAAPVTDPALAPEAPVVPVPKTVFTPPPTAPVQLTYVVEQPVASTVEAVIAELLTSPEVVSAIKNILTKYL
jgi:hypothetical protein